MNKHHDLQKFFVEWKPQHGDLSIVILRELFYNAPDDHAFSLTWLHLQILPSGTLARLSDLLSFGELQFLVNHRVVLSTRGSEVLAAFSTPNAGDDYIGVPIKSCDLAMFRLTAPSNGWFTIQGRFVGRV